MYRDNVHYSCTVLYVLLHLVENHWNIVVYNNHVTYSSAKRLMFVMCHTYVLLNLKIIKNTHGIELVGYSITNRIFSF